MILIKQCVTLIMNNIPQSKFALNITYVERMEGDNHSPFFM